MPGPQELLGGFATTHYAIKIPGRRHRLLSLLSANTCRSILHIFFSVSACIFAFSSLRSL